MKYKFKEVEINYKLLQNIESNNYVVFLHGWGGSIDSFLYFANKLSSKVNCLLLDFPPFGDSQDLVDSWSINDYALMVKGLLQSLGIKKAGFVAHSFGARVVLEIASKGYLQVDKILLTGAAGIKTISIKRTFKIFTYKFLKLLTKYHLYSYSKLQQKGSEDYKKLNLVMKQTFSNIVSYNQTYLLKKINCPTLLFWGKNDKETPFYFTKLFKKNIKDCEVIATNGGHFTYLENSNMFLNILFAYFY